MAKQPVTKKPSGLSIARSGNTFTLKWKITDTDYKDGQFFTYVIDDTGKDKWSAPARINHKATSKSIAINKNNFYPRNKKKFLGRIGMAVKGNRGAYTTGSGKHKKTHNPTISDWSIKWFYLLKPKTPSASATKDEELTNRCKFSWSTGGVDDSTRRVFTDVEWQSILVKNNNQTNGAKLPWKSRTSGWRTGTGAASGSVTFTEDSNALFKGTNSYIRWFRVRARGPRGASAWRYSSHVYAFPWQAKVKSVKAVANSARGYNCTVVWEAASSKSHPINRTTVQYAIAVPNVSSGKLYCPGGASWEDADISADTKGKDSATFKIDNRLSRDECLWVRVNTQHDSKITYGQATLALTGLLKNPVDLSVQTNDETYKATVRATNESEVPGAVLAVTYVPKKGNRKVVGIIPNGEEEIVVQCPNWSSQQAISFSVHAMVGTWTYKTGSDGVRTYTLVQRMKSGTISKGGAVPVAPDNITVSKVDSIYDVVRVTWDWTWAAATGAQISWADHDDAWESTDEPEIYTISNMNASHWNISGLDSGKTWYIRVRLFTGDPDGDSVTYGPWSDLEAGAIDLSSTPNQPALLLSDSVIQQEGSVTASWVYTTTDKTPQSYAEIAEVTVTDTELPEDRASEADVVIYDDVEERNIYLKRERDYGKVIAHTLTQQHITINAAEALWSTGQTYNLACRVQSASGRLSEWSEIVAVSVADPITCEITQTSLVSQSETEDVLDPETGETTSETRDFLSLTEMPFTITVAGAGQGGTTVVEVQRSASYHLDRPDESEFNGYEGEVVATRTQTGEEQVSFDVPSLIGSLDDGAFYRIVATVKDGLGQTATATMDFEVHWEHQALVPSVNVELDEEKLIAKITPIAPDGALPTDVADIYRLSIDKPELIVQGATFGVTYVDPYPALGEMGGHRVVLRTENGDYITPDNEFALVDSPEVEDLESSFANEEVLNVIDFEGRQIKFYYDTDYSNTWAKDFQETQYLGGSVQGDWNAAVSRSGTLSTKAITVLDQDMLQDVRRLAVYPGICHVRTADGSSYAADVQVSEDRVHDDLEMLASYSLSVTRVDSQGFDGMTLDQWNQEQATGGGGE